MRQSSKTLAAIILGCLCIAVLIVAITRAASFNVTPRPAVTQQAIAARIRSASASKPVAAPHPSATKSQPSKKSASQPPRLTNTGPGNTFAVLAAAVIAGYGWRLRHFKRNLAY